jgi:tetratricopeptide (TPR) repeat protein
MARAQAGWYPDPSGAPGQRYFDGTTWTQWTYAADRGPAPQVRSDQQRGIGALRRGEAGDVVGAVRDLESILAEQVRTLGADHPDALDTRTYLAKSRWRAGDRAGAISDLESVLADQVRVLGRDHPKTLDTRAYLGRLRRYAGDLARAISDLESQLAQQVRSLGPDHPRTLGTRRTLAVFRRKAGDTAGAIRDFESLLADQVRTLGADDPSTLETRGDLAWCRGRAGDTAGAIRDFENLLADQVRILGPDNTSYTQATRLAVLRRMASGDACAFSAYADDRLPESTSPDGRYIVRLDPSTASSPRGEIYDVYTPELYDSVVGRRLLALNHQGLISAKWRSESVVVMRLSHRGEFDVVLDCERLTASAFGTEPVPFDQLHVVIDTVTSVSPGGRYLVRGHPFEASDSDRVDTPELYDTADGRVLLAFKDRHWQLDSADWRSLLDWRSESVVVMRLRNRSDPRHAWFEVVIDCERLTASVNATEAGPLEQLEDGLYASVHRPVVAKPVVGLGLATGAKRPVAKRTGS